MKKFFKNLFWFLCCLGIVLLAVRFGPNLYYRLFSGGNTSWISERFSEELKEKNELVVFETTLTGQDTAKQDAWLIGTVQEVVVPYSYSITFTVDLSRSQVSASDDIIDVQLPAPKASYSKLTVDEKEMKKRDWLYPLTPERYAAIKAEIEARLFDEASINEAYLKAAWETAVKNMESLFQSVVQQSGMGATCEIRVTMLRESPEPIAEVSP